MSSLCSAAIVFFLATASSCFAMKRGSDAGRDSTPADTTLFYEPLKADGTWYNTTRYGDVWHPKAADDPAWRPYTVGEWSFTEQGWTWISDEPFGWAVYHYGRWTHLQDIGLAWVPGTEWAPAWVAWRDSPTTPSVDDAAAYADNTPAPVEATSAPIAENAPPETATSQGPGERKNGTAVRDGKGVRENYVGWAPLPPESVLPSGGGIGPAADVDYEIAPEDYCFVNGPDLGAANLGLVVFAPGRNYDVIGRTVNVTNIVYVDNGGRAVYAGGPDFARVSRQSTRAISVLHLDRQTSTRGLASSLRDSKMVVVTGSTFQVVGPNLTKSRHPKDRPPLAKAEVVRPASAASVAPEVANRARAAMIQQPAGKPNRLAAEEAASATRQALKQTGTGAARVSSVSAGHVSETRVDHGVREGTQTTRRAIRNAHNAERVAPIPRPVVEHHGLSGETPRRSPVPRPIRQAPPVVKLLPPQRALRVMPLPQPQQTTYLKKKNP